VITRRNRRYCADNFEVLQSRIKDEAVDVVYLDSFFNSGQDYNAIISGKDGSRPKASRGAPLGDSVKIDGIDLRQLRGIVFKAGAGPGRSLAPTGISLLNPRSQDLDLRRPANI
jgi:hypothetical protein